MDLAIAKHRELSRMWRSAAQKVTEAKKTLESLKRMYETLAEESTESLEHEIVTIERSAGADPRHPRHRESLEYSLGKVSEEDLPQMKDLDDGVRGIQNVAHGVRCGDQRASSKEAVLRRVSKGEENRQQKVWTSQCCSSRISQRKLT